MPLANRSTLLPWAAVGLCLLPGAAGPLCAQGRVRGPGFAPVSATAYELSETVRIEKAEATVRAYLTRVDAYLADGQWEEAIDTLEEVLEQHGEKLVGVTKERFVSVRDFCHLRLASLPAEALELYRDRVDPQAQKWYEAGVENRDRKQLENILEHAFASSWADNALLALGEISLESASYASARSYWERLVPADPPAGTPRTWLGVPDTQFDLAEIRARLVLVSILEGSIGRARDELAEFTSLHPSDARGRLGGREVVYADALGKLLSESTEWPAVREMGAWSTFAGSAARNRILPEPVDVAGVAWRLPLSPTVPASRSLWGSRTPIRRVAERAQTPLSYHPIESGNLIVLSNQAEILAVDAETGKPAWGSPSPVVYRDQFDATVHALRNPPDNLGVPRYTATAHKGKLYARMGAAVTSRPAGGRPFQEPGYLVCLDLEAEGRLLWKIEPPTADLSFEGSPVVDGQNVLVAMRTGDIQPQARVGCFEASTGRLRWQTFICAAETPARGMLHESTHTLLTLERETIYVSTNLGAIAAVSVRDGRVRWIHTYPRVLRGDLLRPAAHRYRDLAPCLFDRGTLVVAPSDSRHIYGLDAADGRIVWQSRSDVSDVVHLLGVAHDHLIASGHKLYWISMTTKAGELAGKVKHVWPEGHERLGYGRGVLVGESVWWPAREKIHVFDQKTGRQERAISLVPRGAGGGNLLIAAGYLYIATDRELIALRQEGTPPALGNGPADGDLSLAPPLGSLAPPLGARKRPLISQWRKD